MGRRLDATRRRGSLGLLLCLCACSPPPKQAEASNDPPADPGIATYLREAPPREPLVAPTRPDVFTSIAIDYRSLPLLPAAVEVHESDTFRYFQVDCQCALLTTRGMVGTVTLGPQRLSVLPSAPGPGPDGCLFAPENVTGVVEGFRLATWEDDAVDFVSIAVSSRRSVVTEDRRSEARARALVPKLLYAFRAPVAGSKAGSEEKLVLLGPRTSWAVTAEPGRVPPDVGAPPFSKVAIEVRRGATASATLTFPWRAVSAMLALRDPGAAFEIDPRVQTAVSVAVEVVWPSTENVPSVLVLVESSHPYDGPPPKRQPSLDDGDLLYE